MDMFEDLNESDAADSIHADSARAGSTRGGSARTGSARTDSAPKGDAGEGATSQSQDALPQLSLSAVSPADGTASPGAAAPARPLADRMRPRALEEFEGQAELVGPGSLLRRMIETDEVRSLIFWGPPGSGKTTLAAIIARLTRAHFLSLSGAAAGIADIKRVVEEARLIDRLRRQRTILFIDEIHRFNRIQQDALLPHVETGVVTLIGATTENPSFSVISPLLSRCRVFTLDELSSAEVLAILQRALADAERGYGNLKVRVETGALDLMARMSDGDARRGLNLLEMAVASTVLEADGGYSITIEQIKEVAQRKQLVYDASGEQHYNLISAFHKSLRGSDPQAAVYWLVRMLTGGEDPLFILRRMLVFAAEDVGNADPQALVLVNAAYEAVKAIGLPEGEIQMTQATIYLATAPKNNTAYAALQAAHAEINRTGSLPVPLVIRNAPTRLMKDLGYGEGYRYDHDYKDRFAPQRYLPDGLENTVFYKPGEFGFEREIAKRMQWWEARRRELAGAEPSKRGEKAPPRAAATPGAPAAAPATAPAASPAAAPAAAVPTASPAATPAAAAAQQSECPAPPPSPSPSRPCPAQTARTAKATGKPKRAQTAKGAKGAAKKATPPTGGKKKRKKQRLVRQHRN